MAKSRTAVLFDGTALYFRSTEGRSERLNYEALDRELRRRAGLLASPAGFDPALFFTAYDPKNEGQAKFLAFVRRLGWEAEARGVWDADPLPKDAPWERGERRSEFIRFDASIAFALGRLVGRRDRIVVVTDSFALERPMLAAATYNAVEKTEIVLAFFGQQLDPRWLPTVKGGGEIKFWDLDENAEALFGQARDVSRPAESALSRLT